MRFKCDIAATYSKIWNIQLPVSILIPPLCSSAQSSWFQTQIFRVRFLALADFLEVVSLERGPLSLVRISE
jgi:hypothetical protein